MDSFSLFIKFRPRFSDPEFQVVDFLFAASDTPAELHVLFIESLLLLLHGLEPDSLLKNILVHFEVAHIFPAFLKFCFMLSLILKCG